MLRRRNGTFQLESSPMSLPATKMRPSSGVSSLFSRRMKVDLPEPDGPDEEDELALLDVDVGVAERGMLALVGLGDVLERIMLRSRYNG